MSDLDEKEAIKYLEFLSNEKCECEACQRAKKEYKTISNLIKKQQKEIEEKRIIIFAGAEKVKQLEKGNRRLMESRIKWKDRYYKQKHEIKELKEQNNQLSNYLNDSYYISADKIREIFQFHIEQDSLFNDDTHKMAVIRLKVVLQELLEENK